MQIAPIDLTSLVATIMGISIVLIPVIGLTARLALKPTVEALSKFLHTKGLDESVSLLERRMALMESQVEAIEGSVRRLAEVSEFNHALKAGDQAEDPGTPG
jgi:hypothetical protein